MYVHLDSTLVRELHAEKLREAQQADRVRQLAGQHGRRTGRRLATVLLKVLTLLGFVVR